MHLGHESGGFFIFLMVPILFFIGVIAVFGLGSIPAQNAYNTNSQTDSIQNGIAQVQSQSFPDSKDPKYQPCFCNGYIGGWAWYIVDVLGSAVNHFIAWISLISIISSQANGVGQLLSSPLAIFIYVIMIIMLIVAIVIRIW